MTEKSSNFEKIVQYFYEKIQVNTNLTQKSTAILLDRDKTN